MQRRIMDGPSAIAPAGPLSRVRRIDRLLLFVGWLAVMLFIASRHVFWRDEIRALSIALRGDDVVAMLRGLHGEGHPALWYLILRGAHVIVPVRQVLPVMAGLIGAAAMAILVFRSPFRWWILAIILFGSAGLLEYAVSARNYGIAVLVLFVLVDRYPQHRDRGILLGVLLAVLCNTNVLAAIMAAGVLLFWLVELLSEDGPRWTPRIRGLLVSAVLAMLGVAACFLEVYPTVNDAAVIPHPGGITATTILRAILLPYRSFADLVPEVMGWSRIVWVILSVLMFGSLLGLVRSPAAFLSSTAVVLVFELFFRLVYPGSYRHQALPLFYMIAMYWLVARGRGGVWPARWCADRWLGRLSLAGTALFVALLALQLPDCLLRVASETNDRPVSRARDVGDLLRRRHLLDATLIANPDTMLEAMPYYAPNPIYLLQQRQFATVVHFTRQARLRLTLDDLLATARALRARNGRPVVILLAHRLDPAMPAQTIRQSYVWTFEIGPDQVRRFMAATQRIARMERALSDESYDVYLLPADKSARSGSGGA